MNSRIYKDKIDINMDSVKNFYDNRVKNSKMGYNAAMLSDDNKTATIIEYNYEKDILL